MLTHYGLPILRWVREKTYEFASYLDNWTGLFEDREDKCPIFCPCEVGA
jgi:hypothetical protein